MKYKYINIAVFNCTSLLWVDGLVSDKRLLCKTSRTENEHESYLDLASVPVEFNEHPIEVLPGMGSC